MEKVERALVWKTFLCATSSYIDLLFFISYTAAYIYLCPFNDTVNKTHSVLRMIPATLSVLSLTSSCTTMCEGSA